MDSEKLTQYLVQFAVIAVDYFLTDLLLTWLFGFERGSWHVRLWQAGGFALLVTLYYVWADGRKRKKNTREP